jgi:hypothetical protein
VARVYRLKYKFIVDYTAEFEWDEDENLGGPENFIQKELWDWDEITISNSELDEDSIEVMEVTET